MSEPKKLNYFEKKEQNKAHAQQVIRWASKNREKEIQALSEATVLMPAPSVTPEGQVKFEKTENRSHAVFHGRRHYPRDRKRSTRLCVKLRLL